MTRNPERSMWAAVVLTALDDFNRDYCRAVRQGEDPAPVLTAVRRYFNSRDGRTVCACAGLHIGPDQAVAAIAMPRRDFKQRQRQDDKRNPELRAAE